MTNKCKTKIFILVGMLGAGLLISQPAQAFFYEDRVSTTKGIAHYATGQVYDLLGETNRAVLEYEKANQYDPGSYLIELRLGIDYARLGLLKEAKEALQLVQTYNPEDIQSHYLLALIYSTQGDYEKAAQEYELILKKFSQTEPENIQIYGYLGQLYYSQHKYDQAVEQFEKILKIDPENADVMYLLGSLYLDINQEKKATDLLKKSIEINPNQDGSLNSLAYVYAEKGQNLNEALDLVNRALKVDPNNGAYLDTLGWIYFQNEKYEKALEILKRADQYLKDPTIYQHIGDTCYKLNLVEDAIKYWQSSLELLPNQEDVIKKIEEVKSHQASR